MSDSNRRVETCSRLRDAGCRVVTARDGADLLRKLGTAILDDDPVRRPALIIADLALAGCSGLSILEGLRALLWDTPFFLVVADSGADMARRAFALGATRVFAEPIDPDDVCAAALTCLLVRAPRTCPRPTADT